VQLIVAFGFHGEEHLPSGDFPGNLPGLFIGPVKHGQTEELEGQFIGIAPRIARYPMLAFSSSLRKSVSHKTVAEFLEFQMIAPVVFRHWATPSVYWIPAFLDEGAQGMILPEGGLVRPPGF